MGNKVSIRKVGFEDVQYAIQHKKKHYILINTLNIGDQSCLIPGTIDAGSEEATINKNLNKGKHIIIYGKNANDNSIFVKYEQLITLGYNTVFVYTGGIFEWLLLQDIYGKEFFPTTTEELDILKYKPMPILQEQLLLNV